MNILVVSDNEVIFKEFRGIFENNSSEGLLVKYGCSPESKTDFENWNDVCVIDVKSDYNEIISEYDLVISCHCKKIFPATLVNSVRCINIHPGLNPYNRGWYPQVFSIINKLPHGATIHVMDEEIDHGDIICQKEVKILPYDTSLDVYKKIISVEIELFRDNFELIISGKYEACEMSEEGNYNGVSDFKELCKLDLNKVGTLGEHIDLLRALTHGNYKNAFFTYDNKKVYVGINFLVDSVRK
ncbi:dTDP-4-amino-4,6-dideoxyglucose formyltransferase [Vibrio clamense]|uniref:dTDP-4-amino-4,6-dideoxyglucose formyltransferase n=1 Tax=Vibrio clamense TaxID=2910254 RepID=UPI003D1F49F2